MSESILFAINDSIAKKADVINLSLGSSAGYVDESNVEQMAVKKAVDNGVIVVAAAGTTRTSAATRCGRKIRTWP